MSQVDVGVFGSKMCGEGEMKANSSNAERNRPVHERRSEIVLRQQGCGPAPSSVPQSGAGRQGPWLGHLGSRSNVAVQMRGPWWVLPSRPCPGYACERTVGVDADGGGEGAARCSMGLAAAPTNQPSATSVGAVRAGQGRRKGAGIIVWCVAGGQEAVRSALLRAHAPLRRADTTRSRTTRFIIVFKTRFPGRAHHIQQGQASDGAVGTSSQQVARITRCLSLWPSVVRCCFFSCSRRSPGSGLSARRLVAG
ncbi:hypothetical protein BDY21DRAFT_10610 [Lineolata rhizophorae]|uniref:Uncharacterized protein n=1 Tax=Lineolata rhizophorae TaxID=578093 RepID=A0A6A6PE22_9PEZI|nr:hypothetical protein BDY21DRAFT_10610 [Lineolata rhizophorae]